MTSHPNPHEFTTLVVAVLSEIAGEELGLEEEEKEKSEKICQHTKRIRKKVNDVFSELGPCYTRRAYRMDSRSFWCLHRMLKPWLQGTRKENGGGGAWNGLIDSEIRLSTAIRHFAGGRPDDICLVHGMSHTEVFNSVWKVVDAVLNCDGLTIGFPEDYNKQREIAKGFEKKSYAGFDCCAGAIDGMLLWIEKPHARDCDNSEVGAKKFYF